MKAESDWYKQSLSVYDTDINKISKVTKRKYKQSKPSGKGYYE